MKADNSTLMTIAAHNRSLCFGRLGNTSQHYRWAILACKESQRLTPGSWSRISALAELGFATISRGRKEVAQVIDQIEEENSRTRYPWVRQNGELFQAPLEWVIGRHRRALAAVRRARRISPTPLSIDYVGLFSLWSTVLLLRSGNPSQALEELRGPDQRLAELDQKDQLEVLYAIRLARAASGLPYDDVDLRLNELRSLLPDPVFDALERFRLQTTAMPPKSA
jgi:hypothetical protein